MILIKNMKTFIFSDAEAARKAVEDEKQKQVQQEKKKQKEVRKKNASRQQNSVRADASISHESTSDTSEQGKLVGSKKKLKIF